MATAGRLTTRLLALLAAMCVAFGAAAADRVTDERNDVAPEIWLNAGFLSLHFDRDADHNEINAGIGGEYRWSPTYALTAGVFRNSNRHRSHYIGWYWQPLSLGRVRLGTVIGVIDGYPKMRDGDWFPVVIPALSAGSGRFGANLMVIPSYRDRLDGALSLQLKWRV